MQIPSDTDPLELHWRFLVLDGGSDLPSSDGVVMDIQ